MNVVFLGDEPSAAGYRLAGVDARTVASGDEASALARACAAATLVLVSASVAARIADATLRAASAGIAPLVVIVPDLSGDAFLPDVVTRLGRQLGLVEATGPLSEPHDR